jgi:hypothetical protein
MSFNWLSRFFTTPPSWGTVMSDFDFAILYLL